MEDKALKAMLELLPNEALAKINVMIAEDSLNEETAEQLLKEYGVTKKAIANRLKEMK